MKAQSKACMLTVQRWNKTTGRLPLNSDFEWDAGDIIKYEIVDKDTVTLKRVFKIKDNLSVINDMTQ